MTSESLMNQLRLEGYELLKDNSFKIKENVMNNKIYTTANLDEVEVMATAMMCAFFREDNERVRLFERNSSRNDVSLVASLQEGKQRLNLILSVSSLSFGSSMNRVSCSWNFYDFLYKEKDCIASFFAELKANLASNPIDEVKVNVVINFLGRLSYREQINIGMSDIKKFSDMPLYQVTRIGVFNKIEDLKSRYDSFSIASNGDALFAEYWKLCQQFKPIKIEISELSMWSSFAQNIKQHLTIEEIEQPFVKLFNETDDEGYKRKICLHLLDGFGDAQDEVLSEYVNQHISSEGKGSTELSKKVDLNQFESFVFNESFFEGCNLSFETGNVVSLYEGAESRLKTILFSTIMSLVANKKMSEFSGVSGYSMFGYPGNGVCFFLNVVNGYDRIVFEGVVKEAINLIVSETNKKPLKSVDSLGQFNIDVYFDMLMVRVNRFLLDRVIVGASNSSIDDVTVVDDFKL